MTLTKLIFPFFLLIISISAQSYRVTDDLNNSLSFINSPQKVISLAPNITEMIYILDEDEKLIGNTKYCYYPEEAKSVTKVGDMLSFNYEKIVELNPDLIFITVEGNQKTAYEKLVDLGFKVFVSNPRDYEGIKKTFSDLGLIFQKSDLTNRKIEEWDSTFSLVKEKSKEFNTSEVMILVELNPIMVAGENSFINSYIEICNMKNFAADLEVNYPVFSREVVLKRDPEILVYPSSGTETIETLLEIYPEWESLSSIKNGNVFFVDRDLYFRPGPRFIEALEDFFSRLKNANL